MTEYAKELANPKGPDQIRVLESAQEYAVEFIDFARERTGTTSETFFAGLVFRSFNMSGSVMSGGQPSGRQPPGSAAPTWRQMDDAGLTSS